MLGSDLMHRSSKYLCLMITYWNVFPLNPSTDRIGWMNSITSSHWPSRISCRRKSRSSEKWPLMTPVSRSTDSMEMLRSRFWRNSRTSLMMSDSDTMRLFSAGILTSSVVVNWQVLSLSEMPQKNEALFIFSHSFFVCVSLAVYTDDHSEYDSMAHGCHWPEESTSTVICCKAKL